MSLVVATNLSSHSSLRYLHGTSRSLQRSIARLSSGFRINTAADDPAGLAISEGMKRDIRSLNMAARNASDAISVVQTAEGALGSIGNLLGRMRELVVQANNGALNNEQRRHIQTELQQLKYEIENVSEHTTFNGKQLLRKLGGATMDFQVGVGAAEVVRYTLQRDFNMELGQARPGTGVGIGRIYVATGRFATDEDDPNTIVAVGSARLTPFGEATAVLDRAISEVSTQRAAFGALQNRLEHKLDNLAVYRENLEAANSRIRDVDVAAEMANLTKHQILMQSGTAMLAQSIRSHQYVLSLLR